MALMVIHGKENAPLEPLKSKTVAVIGFGNQGHAHALNLRDSGLSVVIGTRSNSPSAKTARSHDFEVVSIAQATARGDLVIFALPDEAQPEVLRNEIAPHLKSGATIGFIHGFNIRFGLIKPPANVGVILVAPKGPGHTLRERFVQSQGIPCLFAMHQDSPAGNAQAIGLAWANGIGCARAGIILTTFAHETEADLFGEQAVLCGGMMSLIIAAFETLVNAGYPPELAYLECCHEVKQIADLVYERGLAAMTHAISNTAEFGAYQAGPLLIDEHVRQQMREILHRIQDGTFARTMNEDYARGFAWFNRQRELLRQHPIESAGQTVRAMMPWLAEHGSKPVADSPKDSRP